MDKAPVDGHHLWEKVFGPRMHEISGKKSEDYHGLVYGIAVMLDCQNFDYWAAMPAPEGPALPAGMQAIELPAGLYAGCHVASMEQLGEVYTYLYETWATEQKEYAVNMQAPCFEYYDKKFYELCTFEVYIPVLKK